MGERFYLAQKEYKPKRKLKKDYIEFINNTLESDIEGLDKCTIATLEKLGDVLFERLRG